MSDLICDNYSLLMVMSRFGLSLGFGDKSVKDVCTGKKPWSDTAPYSAACLRFGAFCGAIRFPAVAMTLCRKSGKKNKF